MTLDICNFFHLLKEKKKRVDVKERKKKHTWEVCRRKYVATQWQICHVVLIGFREPYVPGQWGVCQTDKSFHNHRVISSGNVVIGNHIEIASFFFFFLFELFRKISSLHKQTAGIQQRWSPLKVMGPRYLCANISCYTVIAQLPSHVWWMLIL